MEEPTKRERRRRNILDEHWLKYHGDAGRPRFAARQAKRVFRLR